MANLSIIVFFQPYRKASDNTLAVFFQFLLITFMLVGIYLSNRELAQQLDLPSSIDAPAGVRASASNPPTAHRPPARCEPSSRQRGGAFGCVRAGL